MKMIMEHIKKHINKHGKITVYSQENIPLEIHKELYINCDGATFEFELECTDLANYCNAVGLTVNKN